MRVLVTGAYGRVGTAILDHLDREFVLLDRADPPAAYDGYESHVGDVSDYEAIRPAFDGVDAVVHLAARPVVEAPWPEILEDNVVGTANVLRAAREAGVEQVVFASSNHTQGMYELDYRPEIYEPGFGLRLDHTDPVRPDSFYGTSKAFGEHLGRQYVELYDDGIEQFHALRIGATREAEWDHPYGDAERQVAEDEIERGSEAYHTTVRRMKALWQSRRDLAQLVACCLDYDEPGFDVFNGVSANAGRWFDISHAREVIGYRPLDGGHEYDEPPA
ncbi:MAG: NAD-dependent epimerase/dehydratase family protein [Haloarculaceae archaeon]